MAEEQQQTTELKNTVTIEGAGPCKKRVSVEIPQETIKKATDEQYETLRRRLWCRALEKDGCQDAFWRSGSAKRHQNKSS